MLAYTNDFFFQYFSLLTLALNTCLCFDLILTLRNPFQPAKIRMMIYLGISVVACIPLSVFTLDSIAKGKDPSLDARNLDVSSNTISDKKQRAHLILAWCLSLYLIIAIYSCVYASRRLDRMRIDKTIRKYFLRKHFYYVGIFAGVWGCYLANAYYDLFYYPEKKDSSDTSKKVVEMISKIASVSTGVLLTIIRTGEPYFRYQVKKRFFSFFGVMIKDKPEYKTQEYKNTLNFYLTQSLNLELVNVILTSIVTFTKRSNEIKKAKKRATVKLQSTMKRNTATGRGLSTGGGAGRQSALQFDTLPKHEDEIVEEDPESHFGDIKKRTVSPMMNGRDTSFMTAVGSTAGTLVRNVQDVSNSKADDPDKEFKQISKLKLNRIKILKPSVFDSDIQKVEVKRETIINQSQISVDEKDDKILGQGNNETQFEMINESVTIYEHAGSVFRDLRELEGITSREIINSLRPENNLKAIKGAGESQGKSGSFFFFSQDKRFIIKTMNDGELATFKGMFKDYQEYIKARQKKGTLLARIYGIFTVCLEDIVPVHLIMMANT